MLHSLFFQARSFVTTGIRNLFMSDANAGFLFNEASASSIDAASLPCYSAVKDSRVKGANNAFVTKIEWAKRANNPFHEFLIFFVKEKDGSRSTVILVERCAGKIAEEGDTNGTSAQDKDGAEDGTPTDAAGNGTNPVSPPGQAPQIKLLRLISSSSPLSRNRYCHDAIDFSTSTKDRPAQDGLLFSTKGTSEFVSFYEGKYELISTLHLREGTFSVPQVAVLVNAIHTKNQSYSLLKFQCYWFAGTIYSAVATKHKDGVIKETNGPAYCKRGHYGAAEVHRVEESKVLEVIEAFDGDWEVFQREAQAESDLKDKAIQDAKEGERKAQEKIREESDLKDKAIQDARDSERRAQESERRAQESERRAQESERRAQEKIRELEELLTRAGTTAQPQIGNGVSLTSKST